MFHLGSFSRGILFVSAMFLTGLGSAGVASAAGGCGQNAATFTNPAGHVVVCPVRASTNNCGVLSSGTFTTPSGVVHVCPMPVLPLP